MWLVPALAALAIAGGRTGLAALFLACALALFLARYPLFLWARGSAVSGYHWRWLGIYTALSLLLGGLVVALGRLWLLLPLGVLTTAGLGLHLLQVHRRQERSLVGELLGVAGLTLAGPATYYVASGGLDGTAVALWALSGLYFGHTVFYVKLRVFAFAQRRHPAGLPRRLGQAWQLLLYQAVALLAVAALAGIGLAPWATMTAYVPATAQVAIGVGRATPALSMMRLGFTQLGHSIVFGLLLVLAFRLFPG